VADSSVKTEDKGV